MLRYTLQRVLQAGITLLVILIVMFVILRTTSDPVATLLPQTATQQDFEEMRRVLGLDQPIPVQLAKYVGEMVTGDFGTSLRYRRPVMDMITNALPISVALLVVAAIVSTSLGVALGILAAVKRGTLWSSGAMTFAGIAQALPSFWLALLLILFLVVKVPAFSITQGPIWQRMILPVAAMSFFPIAAIARITMSGMLDALDSEFVRLVRIKGMSERNVIFRHAFRNASIPVLTQAGLQVVTLTNSVVLVETIFALNGLGKLSIDGVNNRDFPLVQGAVLLIASVLLALNLAIDLLYGLIDPRIRYR